jgi:hypothetical protein
MTKEELMAMGLTAEMADKVIAQQAEEMKGFVPRARLDEESGKVANLTTQLADRDKDIATLRKDAGKGSDLEKQLTDLQSKYQSDTEALNKQLADQKLDNLLDTQLLQAKARDLVSVKAHIKRDGIKVKDDGTLEGLDLDSLRKEKPYLFEIQSSTDEGTGFNSSASGGGQAGSAITQEVFKQNINNVAWIQANMEAVQKGLADGTLKKG